MANSVYSINKGINKSIEFKGLKAQYILYLGVGMLALIFIFFILYTIGISQYICLVIVLGFGALLIFKVYQLSHKYGEYGMMKMIAKKSIPKLVKSNSRRVFIGLNGKLAEKHRGNGNNNRTGSFL